MIIISAANEVNFYPLGVFGIFFYYFKAISTNTYNSWKNHEITPPWYKIKAKPSVSALVTDQNYLPTKKNGEDSSDFLVAIFLLLVMHHSGWFKNWLISLYVSTELARIEGGMPHFSSSINDVLVDIYLDQLLISVRKKSTPFDIP